MTKKKVAKSGKVIKSENAKEIRKIDKEFDLAMARQTNDSLVGHFGLDKRIQVGIWHLAGYDAITIEKIVDTTLNYIYNCIKDFRHKPKIREKVIGICSELPTWFRTSRQANLPLLAAAQTKAAQMYLEDPSLLIDKPQLAKHMASQAGVKMESEAPSVQFIKIDTLVQIQQVVDSQQAPKQIEAGEIIDAESSDIK